MSNVLIALAGNSNINVGKLIQSTKFDYIIAVDGGIKHLKEQSVDLLIGDNDSITQPKSKEIAKTINYLPEKSETDFQLALNYVENNFDNAQITVIGFVSTSRIEHFWANINLIKSNMVYLDEHLRISMLEAKSETKLQFASKYQYISLFALHEDIEQLTLTGFKYETNKICLKQTDVYGISNEPQAEQLQIEISNGKLLIFESNEQ